MEYINVRNNYRHAIITTRIEAMIVSVAPIGDLVMLRVWLRLCLLVTAIVLGGCCSSSRESCPVYDPATTTERVSWVTQSDEVPQQSPLQEQIEDALQAVPGQSEPHHVLVLSGGGRYGAWGAGVLKGWRSSSSNPRPSSFRVVTAISTGALLATHAFLGTAEDDQELANGYLGANNDLIYNEKSLLSVVFGGDALNSTEPLRKYIRSFLTRADLERVGQEADKGRKLYFGSVDLDNGYLTVWDMTAIAKAGNYDRYVDVMMAATAVPVIFPPVMIDGNMHVDGGAREQLFLRSTLLPKVKELSRLAAQQDSPPPVVHIIINGRVGVDHQCVSDCILKIALRSVGTMLDENMLGNLYRIADLATKDKLTIKIVYIPLEQWEPGDSHNFDPAVMKRLYDSGLKHGANAPWGGDVPDIPVIGPKS